MASIKIYDAAGSGMDISNLDLSFTGIDSLAFEGEPSVTQYDIDTCQIKFPENSGGFSATVLVDVKDYSTYSIESISLSNTNLGSILSVRGLNLEFNIYGDFFDDAVFSNFLSGNDVIEGNRYADSIKAESGNDILKGNGGNDTLNGGTGADTLLGGAGNDTFVVDNLGDRVYETTAITSTTDAGGIDLVKSSVSFTLGNFVEKLTLSGASAINGTGNSLANTLVGNSAANALSGGGGNDTLVGGAGKDKLTGGTGSDLFDFNALGDTGTSSTTRDVITDFTLGDRIDLSTLDANAATTLNEAFVFIGSQAFASNATGQLRYVYNSTSHVGVLYGSTDADSTAEFSVELTGMTSLSAASFVL